MASWLIAQRESLENSLRAIRSKRHLVVTEPYFNLGGSHSDCDVHFASVEHYHSHPEFRSDIFFSHGYRSFLPGLRYMRNSQRSILIVNWFWDNHHLFDETMHSAMLSDVYFYAHDYCSSYIHNASSINGGFVPLCCIFWQYHEVEIAATKALFAPRSDLLYGGYNSYAAFPERDILINRLKDRISSNNLFITPHGTPAESHPFYSMTPVDRMLEWMHHKVSLCISFGGNTAIRIFDMLLGGGIPLILGRPADLDAIIPRPLQEELPVVVVDDSSPDAVDAAYRVCLARFDEGGLEGVMRRHRYVKDNHMPQHRLGAMIDRVRALAERAESLDDILGPVG